MVIISAFLKKKVPVPPHRLAYLLIIVVFEQPFPTFWISLRGWCCVHFFFVFLQSLHYYTIKPLKLIFNTLIGKDDWWQVVEKILLQASFFTLTISLYVLEQIRTQIVPSCWLASTMCPQVLSFSKFTATSTSCWQLQVYYPCIIPANFYHFCSLFSPIHPRTCIVFFHWPNWLEYQLCCSNHPLSWLLYYHNS